MKKSSIFILTCMVMLLAFILPPGARTEAAKLYSLKELAALPPARWQQTYQAGNRTIDIDVAIEVPHADKAPLLQVSRLPALQGEELTRWLKAYGLTANEQVDFGRKSKFSTFFGSNDQRTAFSMNMPAPNEHLGEGWQKVKEPETSLPDYQLDKAYAPRNPLTIQQAFDIAQLRVQEVMGADIRLYLDTVATKGIYKRSGNKPLRDMDWYVFNCFPLAHGIPCLPHPITGPDWFFNRVRAEVYADKSYSIYCSLFQVDQVLAEDLPLCAFETAKPAFEQLIQESRIRKIYKVQLAYAHFFDKDKGFILVPVWNAWCEIYKSAQAEMNEFDQQATSYYERSIYQPVIVHAQTGKLLYIRDNSPNDSWFAPPLAFESGLPEMRTWEQVK